MVPAVRSASAAEPADDEDPVRFSLLREGAAVVSAFLAHR